MKSYAVGLVASGLVIGLGAFGAPAHAWDCPALVKECQALVAKTEKREGVDAGKLAQAKQGCADALKLHEGGKHKAAVIKAGEAISMAGEAAK